MRETTQAIVGAIRDLRDSWRVLAQTDLAYKLISFALLTPGTLLLLRWAMSRTGTLVVADTEIATFFLTTRQGILALIVVGAILTAITALEMTCLMAIGLAAANGQHLTARGALVFGVSRALLVLRLAANIVARLLVALLPFAAAVGVVYWTLLRSHDINFYLSRRPPEFWTAVSIAAVIVAVLAVILLWTIARWTMALPLVLFEGVSPRRALAESSARTVGHRSIAIAALAMWAALASVLLAVATWVPDFIGRALAPDFSGSMQTLLGFITGLVLLWGVLGLVAAVVNVSMLSLVLLRLYLRVVKLREPGAVPTLGADRWGGAVRLPRAVRIGVAAVSILATIGVVLVVVNVTRRNQQVLVIAHRGASAAAPENTLAAFRLGADLGADFVELDVQESEDGEVVVVHDSDLMKVGGSPLKIWEAPAAALRAVDIGSRKGPQFAGERVPTLADVFALSKGRVRVVVELKSYGHSQRLEERVVEIVEAAGVANETIFMSLDHDMVRRLKQLRPSWTVGVLVAKAIGDLTSLGADFLAVEASLATRAFVRQAHHAGQRVYVWTVNDPAWMFASMANGVDGLITDLPDVARAVVERRGRMSDAQRILVALLIGMGAKTESLVAEEAVQPYTLAARTVLPAGIDRQGTPPSGAFFTSAERATAAANGVRGPAEGPYLAGQPLQGVSSMVPAGDGTWWALADNGYGARANSADFQLVIHRLDPRWGDAAGPRILTTAILRDPDRRIPWTIVCDQTGTPLPAFSFNMLPPPPPACGGDPSARILTGFDLDPESFVRAPDGTFWVSEEFGPFLIHVADDGRVLAPPVQIPGVRSPQNPFLRISQRGRAERPTLAASRGFEGLAISPDGSTLYAQLEGAVAGDDPRDLRLYVYDIPQGALAPAFFTVRLDAPSQTVDLASLTDSSGARVYPGITAPPSGPLAIGELKAVNDHQLLLIVRDNLGDDEVSPRVKKIFLLTLPPAREGAVAKTQLVDLLAIPDPSGLGGEMNFFRLPFYTIESVHVVDETTLLVASDNNFPFSNGRSRSRSLDRKGPLAADDTDIVLIRLGTPLDVDRRIRQSSR